ncbi:CLUMA_CG009566, isoform A [Clunio marinus]|uniref:CLUMA_CG009566, isoform A n=1 Tax=Clunio marinus TaxID=568069 RepID=A0A1J1I7A0_9DIPT|nr:CLUMA_CG009566, isoform A [Clunio marinus]
MIALLELYAALRSDTVVSFHLPRNLYIDPKVFYYTTENQFSLQCVLKYPSISKIPITLIFSSTLVVLADINDTQIDKKESKKEL